MKAETRFRGRRLGGPEAVFAVGLLVAGTAGAQPAPTPEIEVSPAPVVVDAKKDVSPPTAPFYLAPSEAIDRVELLSADLAPVEGSGDDTPRLMASQITFTPATLEDLEAGSKHRVIVTVGELERAGEWKGEIEVRWRIAGADDDPARRGARSVGLEIRYRTRPLLAAAVPSKVVVHEARGTEVTRRLTIEETGEGSGAEGVGVYVEPLLTADQAKALPADATRVAQEGRLAPIAGGGRAEIPLTIDLADAEPGEYTGDLVVTSNAADLEIPVEIKVRARPFWPFVVLLIGVVTALAITYYRTNVLPKDEIRVRIGSLHGHLEADGEFDRYCGKQKVRPQLVLANQHLRDDKVADAKAAVEVAEDLWDHWAEFRAELLADIAAIEALRAEIAEEPGFTGVPAIRALDQKLQETVRDKIPDHVEDPNGLADLIEDPATGWRPTTETGLRLFRRLRDLEGELSRDDEKKRQAIEAELGALATASVDDLQPLLDDALDLHPQPAVREFAAKSAGVGGPSLALRSMARRVSGDRRAAGRTAKRNLRIVRFAIWALAIVLLVVVGWNELYLSDPSFGSEWLADYFKLFAWGFGAEAGRAQIATLIRGWGVPTPIA